MTTDTVPIFVKDGIRLEGPGTLNPGRQGQFEAFGRQPVFKDPAKVPNLELRDPDPRPPASSSGLGGFVRGGGWLFVPVILLVLVGMAMNGTLPAPRRRPLVVVLRRGRRGRDRRCRRLAGAAVRAHHHAAREPADPGPHLHVEQPAGGGPAQGEGRRPAPRRGHADRGRPVRRPLPGPRARVRSRPASRPRPRPWSCPRSGAGSPAAYARSGPGACARVCAAPWRGSGCPSPRGCSCGYAAAAGRCACCATPA